jgi:hypothetical protein
MNWAVDGGIERDSSQKRDLETKSGDVFPALARTACAEPLRPFKRNPSALPQAPFSNPNWTIHLVRLGTNSIGSAAYLPLPLPPVYLPLEAFACDKPSVSLEIARENS